MASRYDPGAAPTIWAIPDDLWAEVQPLLPPEKPLGTPGRPVVPFRQVLDGILYVLRTGCHWKAVPPKYGSGSTCHRRFQQWVEFGVEVRAGLQEFAVGVGGNFAGFVGAGVDGFGQHSQRLRPGYRPNQAKCAGPVHHRHIPQFTGQQ